jgi:hypothetical protein
MIHFYWELCPLCRPWSVIGIRWALISISGQYAAKGYLSRDEYT